MTTDWTRYIFTTTGPEAIGPLVGKKIQGMTPGWAYLIESFDGKRGVAKALRETVSRERCTCCGIVSNSLRNVPICFVDYVERE